MFPHAMKDLLLRSRSTGMRVSVTDVAGIPGGIFSRDASQVCHRRRRQRVSLVAGLADLGARRRSPSELHVRRDSRPSTDGTDRVPARTATKDRRPRDRHVAAAAIAAEESGAEGGTFTPPELGEVATLERMTVQANRVTLVDQPRQESIALRARAAVLWSTFSVFFFFLIRLSVDSAVDIVFLTAGTAWTGVSGTELNTAIKDTSATLHTFGNRSSSNVDQGRRSHFFGRRFVLFCFLFFTNRTVVKPPETIAPSGCFEALSDCHSI